MERIYNQLRNDVTFGKFKPGEHLSEKYLTQLYGVSRMTIREVIGQLASQGYLTIEKNRGAIVTKLSIKDVEVLYDLLERCESYAAGLFADRRSAKEISQLNRLHEKMQDREIVKQSRKWLQVNDEYHEFIYANCGSAILSQIILHLRLRTYRYRMMNTEPKFIKRYIKQHHKILAAIQGKYSKLTDRSMAEHLRYARAHRIGILKDIIAFSL